MEGIHGKGNVSSMKVIVGLGNPGREYANTRHNLGFMVVDELGRRAGATSGKSRFKADLLETTVQGLRLVMVKPQTFMNLSGHAVRETLQWYKVPKTNVLVIVDDLDLPFGTIRLRGNGSHGGHNGLRSIFEQLGSNDVPRLRIGIGRGHGVAVTQVLSRFSPEEETELPGVIAAAADCATVWLTEGLIPAMNRCNAKPIESKSADTPAADG